MWRTLVATEPGAVHEDGQCQDAVKVLTDNHVAFGAVCDGVGSASNSACGAQLAAHIAVYALRENWDWSSAPEEHEACDRFASVVEEILHAFHNLERSGLELRTLACTLIAFVLHRHYLAAMQIGDGFIAVPRGAGFEAFISPTKHRYVNEVIAITHLAAATDFQARVELTSFPFLCATTDGLQQASLHPDNRTAHAPFFEPLQRMMRAEGGAQHLRAYLGNVKGATDDKGVILVQAIQHKMKAKRRKARKWRRFLENKRPERW